ncbi:MAG: hypothetical protein AUJ49_06465 [Desulfovibrionaceae bacterium CG1_02_65_16]|nr:MAG: hypothetical protein AUJ49_06465 [Desulfovibrionaceae bacterium CG1_02_65_16]
MARFPHPEPPRGPRRRVLPVFLPFAGCPGRCVFCNQPAQTGQAPEPLNVVYERLARRLAELPSPGPDARPPGSASPESATPESAAPELAFYGGTFTALPAPWPRRFLELSRQHLMAGRLSRVRCSTRPDAVDALMLAELKTLGLSLVELGVQSFDDGALAASRRGYDGEAALRGCRAVREAGLSLGVQLMPGMPGQTPAAFRTDIAQTSALAPELARLYPCLVLEGTALADSWRGGMYCPWPLPATVDELARALLVLWEAGVPAARIGLAEQEGLTVLAGPRHPALGQMVRARALFSRVRRAVAELAHVVDLTGDDRAADAQPTNVEPVNAGTTNVGGANLLLLPRRLRGEALGQLGALAADYAGIGLTVRFWDEPDLALGAQR